MQQERLRALGQMASGIAHDINNAVSPVALYTESLLENEPNLSTRAREYLTIIQRAIGDVGETVGRMREFYRQREPQTPLTPVDLNSLVEQVVELTRARWSDMPQQRGIDSGCGMDEQTRRRCLEPFFTTKGDRGTGMGLAMVYGVVQRHSGDIAIDSAPGRGTTVRLTFNTHASAPPIQVKAHSWRSARPSIKADRSMP